MIKPWLMLVMLLVLLGFLVTDVSAQSGGTVETSLLTTPNQCADPCFWDFQPEIDTLTDFQQLAAILSPDAAQQDPRQVGDGVSTNGITLQAFTRFKNRPEPVIVFIYLRLRPAVAQAAKLNISNFIPTAMIQSLGNPNEAYLLFSAENSARTNRYRLILVYNNRGVAYVISGKFRAGKVCLVPEDAETITLYLFAGKEGISQYLKGLLTASDHLPLTIRETTNQTPADFLHMVQNPATDCLTLK